MAERWQRWMPFHIDRWRGSPDVRAMHPAARMGYLELLCSCWQSPSCSVSPDPVDLATNSGLGDELWALYGPRILRKFVLMDGELRNEVLFEEWSDALRVYEKRKSGAVRTNSTRTAYEERTDTERLADTQTHTLTSTETEQVPKQKPSRSKVASDSRHTDFRVAFRAYFLHKSPSLTQEPWDGQEASQLNRFLKKNPAFTLEQWKALLTNRARSPVPHGESLSTWIGSALKWTNGPTDAFGKPPNGGSNGRTHATRNDPTNGNLGVLQEVLAEAGAVLHNRPTRESGGRLPLTDGIG